MKPPAPVTNVRGLLSVLTCFPRCRHRPGQARGAGRCGSGPRGRVASLGPSENRAADMRPPRRRQQGLPMRMALPGVGLNPGEGMHPAHYDRLSPLSLENLSRVGQVPAADRNHRSRRTDLLDVGLLPASSGHMITPARTAVRLVAIMFREFTSRRACRRHVKTDQGAARVNFQPLLSAP
jgi:hypothetical protein